VSNPYLHCYNKYLAPSSLCRVLVTTLAYYGEVTCRRLLFVFTFATAAAVVFIVLTSQYAAIVFFFDHTDVPIETVIFL
jgi:hypothetical protein